MPQIERVIRLEEGEALIIVNAPPLFLSAEEQGQRETVLERAAASISANAMALRDRRSGRFEDLEHVRESLGEDFAFFSKKLREYRINRPELTQTLTAAMSTASCTASEKRLTVDLWNREFDLFLENPPRAARAHSHAA